MITKRYCFLILFLGKFQIKRPAGKITNHFLEPIHPISKLSSFQQFWEFPPWPSIHKAEFASYLHPGLGGNNQRIELNVGHFQEFSWLLVTSLPFLYASLDLRPRHTWRVTQVFLTTLLPHLMKLNYYPHILKITSHFLDPTNSSPANYKAGKMHASRSYCATNFITGFLPFLP